MKRLRLPISGVFLFAIVVALGSHFGSATGSPGDINIHNLHNIQKSFDPIACEVTISWGTDECTTANLAHRETSGCQNPSYPYTVNAGGPGRRHSSTFDVTGAGKKRLESGKASDTQVTGCMAATSDPCAGP